MKRYFYAGGEQHELVPEPRQVAVDTKAAELAGLGSEVAALTVTSRLAAGLVLVERAGLDAALANRLDQAGATRSVYRSGAVLVVPMPEVRVELEPDQRDAAIAALGGSGVPAHITADEPGRMSLRPDSGDADDALDLANHIYEQVHPAASGVRMVQLVPKPGPGRGS